MVSVLTLKFTGFSLGPGLENKLFRLGRNFDVEACGLHYIIDINCFL